MKTIEEKIEDEIIEFEANRDSSEYYDPGYKTGFKTGAYWMKNELTSWRDPKEELPEKAGCDFCRDEQGYTIGNMYVCDKCGRQVP